MIPSDLKFNSGKVQPIVGIFAERCVCSLLTRNLGRCAWGGIVFFKTTKTTETAETTAKYSITKSLCCLCCLNIKIRTELTPFYPLSFQ